MDKLESGKDIISERVHGAKKKKRSKYNKKDQPRTIVCRLLNYKCKVAVL